MRGKRTKTSWRKRVLSLALAVAMIAGNVSQTAYGAESVRSENSASGKHQKVIRITEKNIQKILNRDPERRPEVKLSDIPLKGEAKKQSILDEILSMTEEKVLVKKVKEGSAVCLIFVERTSPDFAFEDGEDEEAAFADYLEIITINGGEDEVDFKVELVSSSVIFEDVTESQFQIVGENEDIIIASPSQAQKPAQTSTPSQADKETEPSKEAETAPVDGDQPGDTQEPESGEGSQDLQDNAVPEEGQESSESSQAEQESSESSQAEQESSGSSQEGNQGTPQEESPSSESEESGQGAEEQGEPEKNPVVQEKETTETEKAEKKEQAAPREDGDDNKETTESGEAVASRSLRPKRFVTSADEEEEAILINVTYEEDVTEEFQESLVREGGIVINDVDVSMLKVTRIKMTVVSSIINWAQSPEYYGDPQDGTDNAIRVGKSLLEVEAPDGVEVPEGEVIPVGAGQDFTMTLHYKIENGPPYFDSMGKGISLYTAQDLINNKTVKIKIHVPADLVIKELGTPETDPGDGHWIYTMDAQDVEGSVSLNAYFAGNGEIPLNTLYSLTDQTATEISGYFTVTDQATEEQVDFVFQDLGDPGLEGKAEEITYQWTIVSQDKWTVYNENVNDGKEGKPVTIEEGAHAGEKAILFEYDVLVGLGEGNQPEAAEELYFRHGRAAFASYELKETVTLWEMREGVPVDTGAIPLYMELIPNPEGEYSGQPNDGRPWAKVAGDDAASLSTGQFGTRGYNNTGGTELDTTAATAPYYTSYKVKAYYAPQHFALEYHDPRVNDEGVFRVTNTSLLNYGFTGAQGPEGPEEHDDSGRYQYVNEGASITLKKYLEIPEMKDGKLEKATVLYGSGMSQEMTDAYGGKVSFDIERKTGEGDDDYEPYVNARILEGEAFAPLDELSISSDSDGTLTFYVEPGIYRITETLYPQKLMPVEGGGNNALIVEDAGRTKAVIGGITAEAGKPVEVEFFNKVNSGGIYFEKQGYVYENHGAGAETKPVEGAVFGLFESSDEANPIATAQSDEKGAVSFFPVDPSDTPYILRELTAPEAYVPVTHEYQVTVEQGEMAAPELNGTPVPVIVNKPNLDVLTVKKYIDADPGLKDGSAIASVAQELTKDFAGSFRIQYQKEDGSWSDVEGGPHSLELNGSFQWDLPVYYGGKKEAGAQPTSYRVVESLPANYTSQSYDVSVEGVHFSQSYDGSKKEVISAVFQMRQDAVLENPVEIPVVNIRQGSLSLEKYNGGYGAVSEGTAAQVTVSPAGEKEAVFYLLKDQGGTLVQVGQAYVTDGSGKVTAPNLDVWDGDGSRIDYYWYEKPVDGALLEVYGSKYGQSGAGDSLLTDKGTFQIDGQTVTGAKAAGPFRLDAGGEVSAYAYNLEQKVPVWFVKEAEKEGLLNVFGDSRILWNDSDPDTHFHFSVYREGAQGTKPEIYLEAVNRSEPYFLETGYVYRVIEKGHPDRYMGYEGGQDKTMVIDNQTYYYQELDLRSRGPVELSSPEVKSSNSQVLFVNEEKQRFKLVKTVFSGFDANGNVSVTEERPVITMRLYKAGGDGSGTADTSSYIEVQTQKEMWVEPGTYFITEPEPPANCVNPAFYLPERSALENLNSGAGMKYYIDNGGTQDDKTDDVVYFGPYSVNGKLEDRSSTIQVEITNYKALGSARGLKLDTSKTPEENNRLAGARIGLYTSNGPQLLRPVENPATGNDYKVVTGPDGTAVFEGLNVYDDKGRPITYIMKEDRAPQGFDLDDSLFRFQLTPGVSVTDGTKDAGAEKVPIVFYDNPLGTVVVQKFWYDRWDQQFGYDYSKNELPGVKLALFEAADLGGETITADFVKILTTQGDGTVTFTDLDRTHVYFVVEMENPQGYILPDGLVPLPEDVKTLTAKRGVDDSGKGTYTLDGNYNYVVFNAQEESDSGLRRKGEILNQRPWVQINLTKYGDRELSKINSQWGNGFTWENENYYYQEIPEADRPKMNGAQFNLYRIPAEEAGVDLSRIPELAKGNPGYLVDTYETGTKLDSQGGQMAGQFMTTILRDGFIYYLEETRAGMGGAILDRPQNMVFVPGALEEYQPGGFVENESLFRYNLNQVTSVDAFNYKWAEGEGQGGVYSSYVKLNKWLQQKDGSVIPLGGVTYELRVGSQLIATLETGLDNEWNPQETVTGQAMSNLLYYEDIVGRLTAEEREAYVHEETHAIDFKLVEVKAPDRVNMAQTPYDLTVTFTERGGVQEQYFWLSEEGADNSGRTRLINTLMEGYHAEVNVFGYVPSDELFKAHGGSVLTDEVLHKDSNLGAERLSGVEMEIYKYNLATGEYEPYNYNGGGNRFTTNQEGSYKFPNGLLQGSYYIVQTSIPQTVEDENGQPVEKYYNMYDQAAPDPENVFQKRFTVSASKDNTVNIYNPERPSLKVTKEVYSGEQVDLSGLEFTLTPKGGKNPRKATVGQGKNTVEFRGLDPEGNKYVLKEAAGKNSPVSDEYQNKAGISLALGYQRYYNPGTQEIGIKKIAGAMPMNSGADGYLAEFTVKNPRKSKVILTKIDGEDQTPLKGAKFSYDYVKFRDSDYADGPDGRYVKYSGTADPQVIQEAGLRSRAWKRVAVSKPTGADGRVTISNLDPGWYRIVEDTAPKGYRKDVIQYFVAVTGDMGEDYLYVETVTAQPIPNRELVDLSVTKALDYGSLDPGAVPDNVTFTLYKGKTAAGAQPVKYARKTLTATAAFTGTTGSAIIKGIPQLTDNQWDDNWRYYLKEDTAPGGQWLLTAAKDITGGGEGAALTIHDNGLIELPRITTKGAVNISVTNKYAKAEFIFKKVEAGNETLGLNGAQFALYTTKAGAGQLPQEENRVKEAVVTNSPDEAGVYTITNIPAADPEGTTYYLYETKTPATHYVPLTEPLEIQVKPGDKLSFREQAAEPNPWIITNESGVDISLVKHPDVYGGPEAGAVQTESVSFTLYVRDTTGGTPGPWTQVGTPQSPDSATGKMTWTGCKLAGREYALYETEITDGRYKNYVLDGIYLGDGSAVTATETLEDGRVIHVLGLMGAAGREYEFQAYNKPAAGVVIRKANVAGLKGEAPEAVFRILDGSGQKVLEDNITTEKPQDEGANYTKATVPLKEGSYILEEIRTGAGYSLIPDDERVITRRAIQIPDSENPDHVYTFTNARTDPGAALEKEVLTVNGGAPGQRPAVENLWWNDSQTIGYGITPRLIENQIDQDGNFAPIQEFVLKDEGLTMVKAGSGEELSYDQYAKDNYSFKSLEIPAPVHESFLLNQEGGKLEAGPVTAEVTFYGFDDGVIGTESHEFLKDTPWSLQTPAGVKVKSFSIQYYDKALMTATEGKYALGQNFVPGTIGAEVVLYQQTYRAEADQVVGAVRNSVKANADYVLYGPAGEMSIKTAGSAAQADVEVLNPDIPTISIHLGVTNATKPQADAKVDVGDTVRYTMGLENISGGEIKSSFVAPILINRFPKGVVPDLSTLKVQVNGSETQPGSVYVNTESDGFTYLMISLKGVALDQGGTVRAEIDAAVTNAIINNGDSADIRNYLYVTSGLVRDPFGLNPGGASYKWKETDEAKWPDYSAMSGTAVIDQIARANKLYKGSQNGYAHTFCQNEFSTSSSVTVLKEGSGNLDGENIFVSEPASAKMSTENGTITYRLITKNTSSGDREITKLRIVDILPALGDKDFRGFDRGSRWKTEVDTTFEPVIWRMDAHGNKVAASAVMANKYYLTDMTGLETRVLNEYPQQPGGKWNQAVAWADAADARALLFDVELSEPLKRNESIVVEFRAKASDEITQEEMKDLAYTYDNNNFSMRYYYKDNSQKDMQVSKEVLTSNLVSVNLQPERTGVGGRIWIDANGNGIQDDQVYEGETRMAADLKKLVESGYFDISLDWMSKEDKNTARGSVGAIQGDLPQIPANSAERKGAVDSMGEFLFYGLYSSVPDKAKGDDELYSPNQGTDEYHTIWNKLVKDSLYAPYASYKLQIDLADKKPDGLEGMILEGAKTGMKDSGAAVNKDNGKSRKPSELNSKYPDETKDNNFIKAGEGSYQSEDFFLWADGNQWDLTKDFGVVPRRNLSVTKVNDSGQELEGAKFSIYGPFESAAEARNFDIQDPDAWNKLVDSRTTDHKGRLTFDGLLYYLPYVLVEEDAPEDYMLRGATISPANVQPKSNTEGEAAWILHYGVDEVTVTNQPGTGDLNLVKVDAGTGKELAGAVFLVKSQLKGYVKLNNGSFDGYVQKEEDATAVTTDGTGRAVIKNLPWDIYQVIEKKAPEGYVAGKAPGLIQIKDGASFTLEVENEKEDSGGKEPDKPVVPGGPDNPGGGGGDTPIITTTIQPDPVPLAMVPPNPTSEVTILEEDVPLSPLPKTGEALSVGSGLAALLSSALMGIYLALHKKKKPDS